MLHLQAAYEALGQGLLTLKPIVTYLSLMPMTSFDSLPPISGGGGGGGWRRTST